MMSVVCRSLRKTNKQLVQIQDAWQEFVPQRLHQVAVPIALHSGVLEVSVDSSPTAFQINRLIRSGLLRQLQQRSGGTLRKIHVRVEQ